jgi:uncharacterized protein YutE (UPF0331/DUF86 family)
MTFDEETLSRLLSELNKVVENLVKHKSTTIDELSKDLDKRWIVERGTIAAAELVFDIAGHILAAEFSDYPETTKIH